MSAIVQEFEHSLALPSLGIGMKTDLFQFYGHCWVFQMCWHIECNTFTASSFRIWNNSTGIPSPPLALFVVILFKAHLTSLSRMSGSRWVITLLWLSGLWRSLLYSSSVYSCHLFFIASASVKSIPFLSFIEPIFAWNVSLISLIFLKRSLVFPILLFSSISLHWSLRKAFLSFVDILWNCAFAYIFPFLFCFLLLFLPKNCFIVKFFAVVTSFGTSFCDNYFPHFNNFTFTKFLWLHIWCLSNSGSGNIPTISCFFLLIHL